MPRTRKRPVADESEVLRSLRIVYPSALLNWAGMRDADGQLERWLAERPEYARLVDACVKAMQRSNETGLELDRLLRELMRANPERGEKLRKALADGDLRRAAEVIA